MTVVTRGYGNGTLAGTIALVSWRGYGADFAPSPDPCSVLFRGWPGRIPYYVYNRITGNPITGDAANHTWTIAIDGSAAKSLASPQATEIGAGLYSVHVLDSETNGSIIRLDVTSTADSAKIHPVVIATIDAWRYTQRHDFTMKGGHS